MKKRTVLALLALAPGCRPATAPPTAEVGKVAVVPAFDAAFEARRKYENPGGMWMPEQMKSHVVTLRELGMKLDPDKLSSPLDHPLGAIVFLGGCSASFVSPEGLTITNHHCATGALQFNSTPENNLMKMGYLAKTRADEKSNGPAARIFITEKLSDVTLDVKSRIAGVTDPKSRFDRVEARQKELIHACEKDRPGIRCSVVSYFEGEQYRLIEQLEIRDVRLVYAPAEGIGNYGGEIDNWRWPRHGGDFAFYRAYVGLDGKPADYDVKNVPYRPKHILQLEPAGLRPHDLVFVAGYPGRTSTLKPSVDVREAVEWFYPRRIRMCEEYLALLARLGKEDPELGVKGRHLERGLANALTNMRGQLDGLVKDGLANKKAELEAALVRFATEHPEHMAGKAALERLTAAHARYRKDREREAATLEAVQFTTLFASADVIVHMAMERKKPDSERDPAFQERNHKRLEQATRQAQQSYARRLDRDKLVLALVRGARLAAPERPSLVGLVVGKAEPTPENIAKAVDALYAKTTLEDVETRATLLREASIESLAKSADPFIKLAILLRGTLQAIEDQAEAYQGDTMLDRADYVAALRAKAGGVLAPDANATLRLSYGTVRGYRPTVGADEYFPFTRATDILKKNTGIEPFDAPGPLLEAIKRGSYGPYAAPELAEVPVDFLSDLHITGGNSGSPTINQDGKLVGLVFDGNYEAMASDWLFMPAITRSIHVDIRYVLWIMDEVDHAEHLLRELGIEPRP
ncbi:MAG: S46 family peptidase [Myxococcales bacterium]|nr:S46 family peptidase [Myxococcales bacterium]